MEKMLYHIMIILLLSIFCIDAATVRFDPDTYHVTEEDTNINVTISLVISEPRSADSTVRISSVTTAGATNQATAGVDYMSFSDTVIIPAGAISYNYTITIFSNPEAELSEVFSASLTFVSGSQLTFNGSNALININDTDVPTVMFDPVTYNITEGSPFRISFVTSQRLLGPSMVRLYDIPTAGAINQATAGVDYASFNGTFTLYPGSTRFYDLYRSTYSYGEAEFTEQFSATLEFVGGWPLTFSGSNATINIIDNDIATVRFSPVSYSVTEGDTNITLNISLVTSQPLLEPSTVRLYSIPTAGATNQATPDLDYMSFNDTISLPAGATRYDHTILIILNLEAESYSEVFSATLEFVSGWPLAFTGSNATITIYDANVRTIRFSSDYISVSSHETSNVTLTLRGVTSGPLLGDTIIRLTDVPLNAANPATRNIDYIGFNEEIILPVGSMGFSYNVTILLSPGSELTEYFYVNMSYVSGAPLSIPVIGSIATIIIYDTSVQILTFSSSEYIASENDGSVTVTVTASVLSVTDTVIRLTDLPTSGGARKVTDYISFSDTLTIPSGQSSVSYSISLVDDTVPESTESFDVKMEIVSGNRVSFYSYGDRAIVTIIDDDRSTNAALVMSGLSISFNIILLIILMTILIAIILYWRRKLNNSMTVDKPPVVTTEASNMVYERNVSYQLHKITNDRTDDEYEDVLH
ncbi:PREDICTED: G-protein coupled receptor 98-like isoform X2 [Amphimedon queenslandica]|uniref:Calx-beta domain-containing protein n=1 Tax=Amphimedon queenslandica TaxID=400682 RepID=A0AAN0II50_AMPQE|nr:PREDICTED: G-protein coupled receptor 98-like isoform X2 [Amphimedon queenslandica]|eukprot:XP_003390440.1 PREDICTED: G-protein coupled receptor 98-like isoform X2 [Amphimedon queenslandica]